MELPWEVPWGCVHADELFLRSIAEERWGLTRPEEGDTEMDEGHPEDAAPEVGSHPILSSAPRDRSSSVAVGDGPGEGLTLAEQMAELEELLREFARKADKEAGSDETSPYYRAAKSLYRCVDALRRFNDGV